MFDPLRAKARVILAVAVGGVGGLALASGFGWTGPTYAMPTVTMAPQVTEEAVRPALDLSDAFANAAGAVTPAVVRIEVTSTELVRGSSIPIPEQFRDFFEVPEDDAPRERSQQGGGSGFIISEDGYILTNDHVVGDADDIRVYLTDGRYFTASLVGTDPTTDVAVIKIEEDGLPFLSLGSSETLRVGEWVLAIGNPGFGGGPASADQLDYTVTAGIVSAKGRPLQLLQSELQRDPEFTAQAGFAIEDYIQTDAVINRGNSGGPMVNIMGQVVGINSAIFSPTGTYVGYGFAIPIDLAARVMEDLIDYGSVRRAWLGVEIGEIVPEDQEYYKLPAVAGVNIRGTTAGGPADKAGLRMGDVLYRVDGQVVRSPSGLQNLVAQRRPGEQVTLEIYRDGSPRDFRIRLGEADLNPTVEPEAPPEEPAPEEKLGIGVQELTPAIAERYGYEEAGGVVISEVARLGPAFRRGIQPGIKLLEIDRQPVRTPEEVQEILDKVAPNQVVSLLIDFPQNPPQIVNIRASG